jgi:hypothetical protein
LLEGNYHMIKNLKPTGQIVSLDGMPWCRVWEGITERGDTVTLYVHRVQAAVDSPVCDDLAAMLIEMNVPAEVCEP